jgi:hypothetical protein
MRDGHVFIGDRVRMATDGAWSQRAIWWQIDKAFAAEARILGTVAIDRTHLSSLLGYPDTTSTTIQGVLARQRDHRLRQGILRYRDVLRHAAPNSSRYCRRCNRRLLNVIEPWH